MIREILSGVTAFKADAAPSINIIDIHCHILPSVDDGAESFGEMKQIVEAQASQGVTAICATPHSRTGMFETDDDVIAAQFDKLKEYIELRGLSICVMLGREYYFDDRFLKLLESGAVKTLGNGKSLLVEFPHGDSFATICSKVSLITDAGFVPVIAHVERYPAIVSNLGYVSELSSRGASIQVNSGSILGYNGYTAKVLCRKLLNHKLVDIVASDAHGLVVRPPNLGTCSIWALKKLDVSYVQEIFYKNPAGVLGLDIGGV